MKKYGVLEEEEEEGAHDKYAGEDAAGTPRCPVCGSIVAQHGRVKVCDTCGTRPWEGREHGPSSGGPGKVE